MRFLASTLFAAALALPVMAQPGRGGPGGRGGFGGGQQAEVEKLKAEVKALEAKLKATQDGDRKKEDKKKEDARKDDKKPGSRPDGAREHRGPEFRGPMGGFGGGPGMSMGMRGHQGGFGPMGGQPGMQHHGMDRLSAEEQATFKKLVAKMMGHEQSRSQSPSQSRRPEPKKPEAGRRPEPKKPEGGRKPEAKQSSKSSIEDRLDRLESMMREMMRSRGGSSSNRR